jgi:hypothetical protein
MCHVSDLLCKYTLVAQREIFRRGGRDDYSTAPHTPALWRRVLSLPHTRLGWWAVGLSAGSLPQFLWLQIFAGGSGIPGVPTPSDPDTWVPPWLSGAVTALAVILAIMVLVAPLASGVVGSLALGAGERSLLVWFAQVPVALFCFGLLNVFREGSPWVRGSVGVLVWAVIAFGIIHLKRSAEIATEVSKSFRHQATGFRFFLLKPDAFSFGAAHPFRESP